MERVKEIQEELQQISSVVAGLPPLHPYQVPADYFKTLPLTILEAVTGLENEPSASAFATAGKQIPYDVPSAYFDHLAANILSRVRSLETGSPAEELRILSPVLSGLDKELPFSTPEGYFDELANDVVAGVNAIDFVRHELESISPLMSAAQHNNVYEVPEDYFNKLPDQILTKVKARPMARVVALNPRKRFFQFAAAAMLAGVMAIGAWMFFQESSLPQQTSEMAGIEKISDDEIIHYLDDNSVALPENIYTASSDLKEEDVQELLTDVSDQELQQYLDQYAISKIN